MSEINNKLTKQLSTLILNSPTVRKKVLSDTISKILQNIPELASYISESNENTINQDIIFFEISNHLLYQTYKKGDFIQRVYDTDNKFIISLVGTYAKIDIKYNRIYLTCKEYLSHLIKLKLLNEKFLYLNCVTRNKKVFPLNENVNILNLKNVTKYLKITDYDDLIKSIKLKIKESPWKLNTSQNIDDFLKLYNPEFLNQKDKFFNSEAKYPTYLPYYIFDKMVNSTALFGHLNRPKNIKNLSAFICLDNCETFYIDKSTIPVDSKIFDYFNEKMSDVIAKNLFDKHFLFKNTDRSFLVNNYSKYFQKIKINKGDFIVHQDRPHDGIFFIHDGLLELESNRSFNELNDLNFTLLHSLDSFPNIFSKIQENIDKFIENIKNKKADQLEQITKSNIFVMKANLKKSISFITYKYPDIVGLNELYDYKSGVNNYSVKCLSDEATVFYVPNEIVQSLLSEENINQNIGQLIFDNRKLIMNSIDKYKQNFIKGIQIEIENSNNNYISSKLKIGKNFPYIKNNIICRSNNNKFNTVNASITNFMRNSSKNKRMNNFETCNSERVYYEKNNLSSNKNNNGNDLLNYLLKDNKSKQNKFNKSLHIAHNFKNVSLSKTAYSIKKNLNNCDDNNLSKTSNVSILKRKTHKNIKQKLYKIYSNYFNENDKNNLINPNQQVGNVSIPIICHENNKFDYIMNNTAKTNTINPNLFYYINNKTDFKLNNLKKYNKEIKIFDTNKTNEGNYSLFGNTQRHKSYIKRNIYNII